MIVAGGVYREECVWPNWSRIFGSGGRAAAAISRISPGSALYAYASREWAEDVRISMTNFGVDPHLVEIEADITFSYFHPLSVPVLTPHPIAHVATPHRVEGAAVLRFGFVEGDAIVKADRAVYDPQHWSEALNFSKNGSEANKLAIVLNETELELSTGTNGDAAAEKLCDISGAEVIVVKRGPHGATVWDAGTTTPIPSYRSSEVFKIGSGDIFSAIFAALWAEQRTSPVEAAHRASSVVSHYVGSRAAQISLADCQPQTPVLGEYKGRHIYVAAPFFNLGQRWAVEEIRNGLRSVGGRVFSPLHNVGSSGTSKDIATRDLKGLEEAGSILAVLDGEDAGTLFEIGYARRCKIPVVILSELPRPESLTMLEGTDCHIVGDICTAVYHAMWAAMR